MFFFVNNVKNIFFIDAEELALGSSMSPPVDLQDALQSAAKDLLSRFGDLQPDDFKMEIGTGEVEVSQEPSSSTFSFISNYVFIQFIFNLFRYK